MVSEVRIVLILGENGSWKAALWGFRNTGNVLLLDLVLATQVSPNVCKIHCDLTGGFFYLYATLYGNVFRSNT